jgi:hypothetical protein
LRLGAAQLTCEGRPLFHRYLALDKSADYITGHCINVDGGIGIGTC